MKPFAVCLVTVAVAGTPVVSHAASIRPLAATFSDGWFAAGHPLEGVVTLPDDVDPSGLRLTTTVFRRSLTRTQLSLALTREPSSKPVLEVTTDLSGRRFDFSTDLGSRAPLDGAPDGVYPVSLSVSRADGRPLFRALTAVIRMGTPAANPLRVVPIAALNPKPNTKISGQLTPDLAARIRKGIESAPVSSVRFLSPLLQTRLEAQDPELASAVQKFVDAQPAVTGNTNSPDASHLSAGIEFSISRSKVRPDFAVPPGFQADDSTLAVLSRFGIPNAFLSGSLLGSEGAFSASTPRSSGNVRLIPTDDNLSAFASQDTQKLRADAAMLYFERPGVTRLVAVSGEITSGAAPRLADLMKAPWVALGDPREGKAIKQKRLKPIDTRAASRAQAQFADATDRVSRWLTPDAPVLANARYSQLALKGSLWFSSKEQSRLAKSATDELELLQSKLIVRPPPSVTFTSSKGQVPVSVINNTGLRARVQVVLKSGKLRFPDGPGVQILNLDPPGRPLTFAALAEASGTFPLEIELRSADGFVLIDKAQVTIRSTAANVVALVLTLGSGIGLIAWFSRSKKRKAAS